MTFCPLFAKNTHRGGKNEKKNVSHNLNGDNNAVGVGISGGQSVLWADQNRLNQ